MAAFNDAFEDLVPRAEIFRSKLIEDFNLLESITSGSKEAPKLYSSDLAESDVMNRMLREAPHSLVKFHVYTTKVEATYLDRRLNRVKTKNSISFGPWARMIVNNQHFHNFMSFLILTNSIVLGVQAEISDNDSDSLYGLRLFLDIFDYLSMLIFIMEIILKWIDEFWGFWKNGWNNFDFFVTVMSLAPEIIKLMSGKATKEVSVIGENLRVFRIFRSLKMVSRFAQLRIIVLTILKAFKSMVFILTLLSLFMYIFAVAGTVMFSAYSKSERTDLVYKNSFSTLGQSLATLFQLFTLDQWFKVLSDLTKVANDVLSKIYIILWICIGSFIFRNIFAGIMVMNFQNIRADFATQCNEREKELEDGNREMMLEVELAIQHAKESLKPTTDSQDGQMPNIHKRKSSVVKESKIHRILEDTFQGNGVSDGKNANFGNSSRETASSLNIRYLNKLLENKNASMNGDQAEQMGDEVKETANWNATVRLNLQNFKNATKETLWPSDTLFRYYQLMEALQGNLIERHQLQKLAVLAISNLHDTQDVSKI